MYMHEPPEGIAMMSHNLACIQISACSATSMQKAWDQVNANNGSSYSLKTPQGPFQWSLQSLLMIEGWQDDASGQQA
jgi:hypothetical protein